MVNLLKPKFIKENYELFLKSKTSVQLILFQLKSE